jgi:hypothetical protein
MKEEFGNYIIYVDESGDHSLESIDSNYPVFVLAFCIFKKVNYSFNLVPKVQDFKFKFFGHDMIVLHEHELRKSKPPFNILMDAKIRAPFMADLNSILTGAEMTIVSVVINKTELKYKRSLDNPYHIALEIGLLKILDYLKLQDQHEKVTHIAFEKRGKKEDDELELEFLRLQTQRNLPFEILFADKKVNSTGLQVADLVARPIGRYCLKPAQQNRAFKILKEKFYQEEGVFEDFGLSQYP